MITPNEINGIQLPPTARKRPKIFTIIGAIFLVIGVFLLWQTVNSISHFNKSTGVVVDNKIFRGHGRKIRTTYQPIVEYLLPDGSKQKFVENTSTNIIHYAVGSPVNVYYNPKNLSEGHIDSFFFLYGMGLFIAIFGAAFILASPRPQQKMFTQIMTEALNNPENASKIKEFMQKSSTKK